MNYKNAIIDWDHFRTVSEFKDCLIRGGEVEFTWKGIAYSVGPYDGKYGISYSRLQSTEKCFNTPDEVLTYMAGDDTLRDIITQVQITNRTL